MEYIHRELNLTSDLKPRVYYSLDHRTLEKVSWLKQSLKPDFFMIYFHADTFHVSCLQILKKKFAKEFIVKQNLLSLIEIQKLPLLMDEVHSLIEKQMHPIYFNGQQCSKTEKKLY